MDFTRGQEDGYWGDGIVIVRRKGSSSPAIANVLDSVPDRGRYDSPPRPVIHKPSESELGGYAVRAAISTILTIPND